MTAAGRELDTEIAEQVMGFERNTFQGQDPLSLWPDEALFQMMYASGFTHSYKSQLMKVPHYSTDIADAWKVYLLLCKHGICTISNGDGDSCDVDFFGTNAYSTAHYGPAHVSAETFELAICLAAREAVKRR